MTLQVSQSVTLTATAPTALTPAASDTIAEGSFGPVGLVIRVITTGTATDVAVLDPGTTSGFGNPGTVTAQTMPATGTRQWLIPRAAINGSTGLATITFSGARTGVTYELKRV
jgi:hypothetical protein